jgi:hypothetical protein
MKTHPLLLLPGLADASSAGCGAKQSLTSTTGTDGGGVGRDAGVRVRPEGGSGPADGGGYTALDGGGGVTETICAGDAGPLDAGPPGDAGVCNTLPADPPAFPWGIPSQIGSGGNGSGCHANNLSGQIVDLVCSGSASLAMGPGPDGGAGGTPTLTWDDGSTLAWLPGEVDSAIPPPIAAGSPDQRVWAQLESHAWLSVPGQCGWAWDQTMELRDSAGGNIRFMARQGASVSEPSSAELLALFGADAQPVTSCTHDVLGGPALFHQSLHDHVLQTTPAQLIPYGKPVRVTAPNGSFDVLWYSRTQVAYPLTSTCAGCLNQGPIVGFVASRAD